MSQQYRVQWGQGVLCCKYKSRKSPTDFVFADYALGQFMDPTLLTERLFLCLCEPTCAPDSVPSPPSVTRARETSGVVCARSLRVTVVGSVQALVYVRASFAISGVA